MAWLVLCLEQECGWTARDETEALAKNWMEFHQGTHPGHRVSITWATWEEKTQEIDAAAARGRIRQDSADAPVASAPPPPASDSPHVQIHGKILIIESSPYLTGRIAQVLRKAGYATLQAPTALEGLQLAAEARPDLILLAIGMPDLDGIRASRMLKDDPLTAGIPIVAMAVGDLDDGPALGDTPIWAGRLQKPVSNEVLLPLVAAMLPRSRVSAKAGDPHALVDPPLRPPLP
jgi:two-component system, cell cycle response regulator DivK